MKIEALDLRAFGPFSGRRLDFDTGHGLAVVYGANEAGKSSALRGLKALLYGIDERTPDNFVHPNEQLRVGGRLSNADGRVLDFSRRKGRKNTLLGADGDAIDQQALTPFLQGVSRELFATLFGIDHQGLLRGGQAILDQQGDVGQTLFSAALGNPALHQLLEQLDAEADALFRPRGSKQRVNAAVKAYAELNRELRRQSLSSSQWEEHRRTLERTATALEQVQQQLADSRAGLHRLQRLQRLLPKFARRRGLLAERAAFGEIVLLAADYGPRRQQAVRERAEALAVLARARPRRETAVEQLAGLSVSRVLLDEADTIEDLHTSLGSHRKAHEDRPHLLAERRRLLSEAAQTLTQRRPDLSLEQVDSLNPVLARRERVIELGSRQAVLLSRLEQADDACRELEQRLATAHAAHAAHAERTAEHPVAAGPQDSAEIESLRQAVAIARRLGDIDGLIDSERVELADLQAGLQAGLARLGLQGALEDIGPERLPALAVPGRDAVADSQGGYEALAQRRSRTEEQRQQAADELRGVERDLDQLQRGGPVPSEAELAALRSERDRLWCLLRRRIDGDDIAAETAASGGADALPDAVEQKIDASDELSDRLRREGQQVLELARLQATEQDLRRRITELDQQLAGLDEQRLALDRDWQALWAAVPVNLRTPTGMRSWLEDLDGLRERAVQWLQLQRQGDERLRRRSDAIQHIHQQPLAPRIDSSDRLEPLLLATEARLRDLERQQQRRQASEQAIDALQQESVVAGQRRQAAREALRDWQEQWRQAISACGLPDDAGPSEAAGFFESLRELFKTLSDAEKLHIRITAIDQDAKAFQERIAALIARLGDGLAEQFAGQPVEDAVTQLNARLIENRAAGERQCQIKKQLAETTDEIADAEATLQGVEQRLAGLSNEAGCNNDDAARERAEQQSAQYQALRTQLQDLEAAIVEAGDGADLDALATEVEVIQQGEGGDALPAQIDALQQRIEQLEPERTELAQRHGREKKELELMDGGDRAAQLADQAQATLAGIRADAEQYIRVRLAARLLREQIERYRRDNQGPLIQRAGEHFTELTIGSFGGLVIDFNDQDQPVLAGLRQHGQRVPVEGMSAGSRDQLYLALRLATLERYIDSAEAMPFIVDDVLVDFDDQRSEAALKALAGLAESTQVILFTHHRQLVNQAEGLAAPVEVHEL